MTYAQLAALPADAYLNPEKFRTMFDNEVGAAVQYAHGLEIANRFDKVTISCTSVWGAFKSNGDDGFDDLSSSEGIGYHSNTAALLRGFLAGNAELVVYRNGPDGRSVKTVIKQYGQRL